jgi:hypothetical protein
VLLGLDTDQALNKHLPALLQARLPAAEDVPVKQALLTDSIFGDYFRKNQELVALHTLTLAAFLTQDLSTPYADWIVERIAKLVNPSTQLREDDLRDLLLAVGAVEQFDSIRQTQLAKLLSEINIVHLISTQGTFYDLLKLLQRASRRSRHNRRSIADTC